MRKAALANKSGKGTQISSVIEPLECQFSPYTALEIENVSHHYELPDAHYTVVIVAERQMGVAVTTAGEHLCTKSMCFVQMKTGNLNLS